MGKVLFQISLMKRLPIELEILTKVLHTYGELLVDEHSSTEEMPYKFNGKEFDEETGLYYYGARYMDPRTSLWYGVDPLAEKYVSTGSYVYCIDNPIRLIDIDGRDSYELDANGNISLREKNSREYDRLTSSVNPENHIDIKKGLLNTKEINNIKIHSKTYGNGTASLDLYHSNESFNDLYRFVIDNSFVEWSYISMKDKTGALIYYMGTTHSDVMDASQTFLLDRALERNYTILSMEHNHDNGNSTVSYGDVSTAKKIQELFPNASLSIVFPHNTKERVRYNRYTEPGNLKGITVFGKKPKNIKSSKKRYGKTESNNDYNTQHMSDIQ